MGSSLRWVIEGKLVLQAPGKHAECQSQECKHPKEAEWPAFAPTIHSHRNPRLILDKPSATMHMHMRPQNRPHTVRSLNGAKKLHKSILSAIRKVYRSAWYPNMDQRDAVAVERAKVGSGTSAALLWRGRNRSVGRSHMDVPWKNLQEPTIT